MRIYDKKIIECFLKISASLFSVLGTKEWIFSRLIEFNISPNKMDINFHQAIKLPLHENLK